MSDRCVVNVATTEHYRKGQRRLMQSGRFLGGYAAHAKTWPAIPNTWPSHDQIPYGFKAFALKETAEHYDLLLWADASILPIRSLEPLWEKVERDGYWIARNGWNNYQWTADSAYYELFPENPRIWEMREVNKRIPHVVATSFGLNVKHPIGKAFLDEYYRLASETKAFCGPWTNSLYGLNPSEKPALPDTDRRSACGPPDVVGHRHDQTAASVIAWRLGMKLTDCPEIFAYSKRRQDGTLHLSDQDERTILLADGAMHDGIVL